MDDDLPELSWTDFVEAIEERLALASGTVGATDEIAVAFPTAVARAAALGAIAEAEPPRVWCSRG